MKIPVIDHTVNETHVWLRDTAEEIGRPGDYQTAYHALRSVLHTVRDTLVPDELMDFSSGLTPLIRGFLFEGYHLSGKPEPKRSLDAFMQAVEEALQRDDETDVDAETASKAVFSQLEKHLAEGQARHVREMLHGEIQELWPAAVS
ncbi:MAG: DUF2267 domain-containing protein [Verrucomicrobiales bacterium]